MKFCEGLWENTILTWQNLIFTLQWGGEALRTKIDWCWGTSLLYLSCIPIRNISPYQGLLPCLWAMLSFEVPSNVTRSPALALPALSVGRLCIYLTFPAASLPCAYVWPQAPTGLLCSSSPGMSLITLAVTHYKIWAYLKKINKKGKESWCNVCCLWESCGPGSGSGRQ